MIRKIPLFLLALLLAAGCNMPTLVGPAGPVNVGEGVRVMPQISWNQLVPDKGHTVWTQNGQALDSVHFATGVQDGKPLYPLLGIRSDDLTPYRSNMLPNDVQDLVISTMQREGYEGIRASGLTPCAFGGAGGFCFDVDFANRNGLLMKGKVAARKRGAVLDLFQFRAPSEYYFPALSPTVDQVFASTQAE
jgi:hypothetical protein